MHTTRKFAAKENLIYSQKPSLRLTPVAVDLDVIQSQGPGYYTLENTYGCGCELKDARDVQLSQVVINFKVLPWLDGWRRRLIDNDSHKNPRKN